MICDANVMTGAKMTIQVKLVSSILIFSAFTMLASVNASASLFDRWPEIPHPPQSKVAWVAENMVQNGVPMKIKTFSSELDKKSIVDFYKSYWSKGKVKPEINELGEWSIIGMIEGDYMMTVQAKKSTGSGESEGFLAISTLPKSIEKGSITVDNSFPRLPGTKVMSDTRSIDTGRAGKTLVLENNHSVRSNASFYMSRLESKGWNIDPMSREAHKGSVHNTYLYFKKNNQSCTITITKLKKIIGSSIVISITNTSV